MVKFAGKVPSSPTRKAVSIRKATKQEPPNRAGTAGDAATRGSSTGFLATTRLKKSGGSLVMTVPAPARRLLQLTEGQEMAVSVEGSKVILEPAAIGKASRVRRPKYTLDELVAGLNPDAHAADDERQWMEAPPAGREIW